MRTRWPAAVAACFGFAVFLAQGGAGILWPTHTSWIPPGSDYGYHWVGWLFFRNAPWELPLGAIPGLLYPVGTTVGYMDGIPWLAFLAKLASPILPDPLQYIGPWLALSFTLQGWFGARLVAALTPSRPAAAIGGALFTVAPILFSRIPHEALCAHWVLLAAFTLVLRREERAPRWAPVLLPAFAMGIHPYLAFMTLGLCAAADVRYFWEGLIRWHGALWRLGLALLLVGGLAWALGYFVHAGGDAAGRGFGHYNSELLSVINARGQSRILPELATRAGQGEGYGFLGSGVLLLGLAALVVQALAWRRKAPPLPWRRILPVFAVALVFAMFAHASRLSILGKDILDLSRVYPAKFGETFRSSGRFIWLLSYSLTIAAIGIWVVRRPRLAPWVLGAALVLQVADETVLFQNRFGAPRPPPSASPDWALAVGAYAHMALYPPRCGDGGGPCCQGFTPPPRREDMYLAAQATRLGLTYNGFGAARVPRRVHDAACRALRTEVETGHLDEKTIYVVAKDREADFRGWNPAAPCRKLDAELVCVAPTATGPLRDRLAAP